MTSSRTFFPTVRAALLAGMALLPVALAAQQNPTVPTPAPVTTTNADGSVKTTTSTTTDSTGGTVQGVSTSYTFKRGKKKKDPETGEKIVQSKDTKRAIAKARTSEALIGVDSKLPDKQLYDKAVEATRKGHFDVARLDLQTMLNTYPDSQYQMRAKLAIADSWYKEGGTAALTQAESEYADFRVFFPNAPEAAEAQMRIGDIYFRQMDRPDRDYAKAMHAEEEYRRMLTDYPDSLLIPQAKQRLREVQELLASREADIASFYGTRSNFGAEVARYQTVVDTYPLYSHMDEVLIGLGDAYAVEAKYIRNLNLPQGTPSQREQYEAGKAKLETIYDGLAADSYRKVVLEHAASPHMEDARDRLQAMGLPIPEPSKEQIAASEALENSRSTYRLTDRAKLIFLHAPDTVVAARIGEPTLTDPRATTAPVIVKKISSDFTEAFLPPSKTVAKPVAAPAAEAAVPAPAPAVSNAPKAPLAFQDVPSSDPGSTGTATTLITSPSAGSAPSSGGSGMGVEVLNGTPAARSSDNGLHAVAPANATPLPAIEKPTDAPDVINDASGKPTAAAQAPPADGKKAKPEFDKADESSSKHKPKKGIKKIIPPNPL